MEDGPGETCQSGQLARSTGFEGVTKSVEVIGSEEIERATFSTTLYFKLAISSAS